MAVNELNEQKGNFLLYNLIQDFDYNNDDSVIIRLIEKEEINTNELFEESISLLIDKLNNFYNVINKKPTPVNKNENPHSEANIAIMTENLNIRIANMNGSITTKKRLFNKKVSNILISAMKYFQNNDMFNECLKCALMYELPAVVSNLLTYDFNMRLNNTFITVCKKNNFKMAEMLINDPRFNPSENNNAPLKYCVKYKRNKIAKLIQESPRFNITA